ncbi:flagellin [Azospirillum sp. SYSU D00513]|uniref:flagellin n=1 Tax=Azospirillum sp. SYSU D00513 TaxID=2812561 RepID=UPI001A966ACA|nr:flagellin [Azospirillum sp. SYSU D00513]
MNVISTFNQHRLMQSFVKETRAELNKLAAESATLTVSDYFSLGSAAQKSMSYRASLDDVNYYKEAAGGAEARLTSMQASMQNLKEISEEFRTQVIKVQGGSDGLGSAYIASGARAYLDQATQFLNTALGGRYIFSGPATGTPPIRRPDEENENGVSPLDAVTEIMNTHDITTSEGMQAFINEVDAAFSGGNFDALLYKGALPADGKRVTTFIDRNNEISLDVRANDDAFKSLLKGLYISAAVSSDKAPPEVFNTLMGKVLKDTEQAVNGVIGLSADVGYREQSVADTLKNHENTARILNSAIVGIEGVDGYEAASRLANLQSQMEITYTLTARLAKLSIINYI